MASGEAEPRLDSSVEDFFTDMQGSANALDTALHESWQRRRTQHNRGIERLTLWHAVRLDLACEQAVERELIPLLAPLLMSEAGPEIRYDIQTAIHMVPTLFPLSLYRDTLREPRGLSPQDWANINSAREPSAFDYWHEWLWSSRYLPDRQPAANDHGDSTLLAIAASRLTDGLECVLELSVR